MLTPPLLSDAAAGDVDDDEDGGDFPLGEKFRLLLFILSRTKQK